ncbi:MAG: hypothetical protein HY556_04975 [Euryarchaeota archaeon]|nr:hypothetical protein [Euryarchaeota archaeon]
MNRLLVLALATGVAVPVGLVAADTADIDLEGATGIELPIANGRSKLRGMDFDVERAHPDAARDAPKGSFAYVNGDVSGKFVAFGFDEATGTVSDYTVYFSRANRTGGVVVLDSMEVNVSGPYSPAIKNATFKAEDDGVTIGSIDGPLHLLGYRTNGTTATVTLDLADGVYARVTGEGVYLRGHGVVGLIKLSRDAKATINGDKLVLELPDQGGAVMGFHLPNSNQGHMEYHEQMGERFPPRHDDEHRGEARVAHN